MYAKGFREAAMNVYAYTRSLRKTAQALNVSLTTSWRWVRANPRPPSRCVKVNDNVLDVIKNTLESNPFVTCNELSRIVRLTCNICISRQLISVAIKRAGYSRKKCHARCATVSDNLPRMKEFLEALVPLVRAGTSVVAIDECGFDARMLPFKGYARRGTWLNQCNRFGRYWKRLHMVASVSLDGDIRYSVQPYAINGDHFAEYLESLPYAPGTILLLDNAGIHNTARVQQAFTNKQFVPLFTPPYCPDANPIENMFGILKHRVRHQWGMHVLQNGQSIPGQPKHVFDDLCNVVKESMNTFIMTSDPPASSLFAHAIKTLISQIASAEEVSRTFPQVL